MKTHRTFPGIAAVTFCLALFALSYNASALTLGDEHELGTATPSIPQGDTAITTYVNTMIGLPLGGTTHVIIGPHDNVVVRSQNDFGSLPGPAFLMLRGKGTTINVGDASYLLAHYGGPSGGFSEVWFLDDMQMVTIPATGNGHGLSGWALFGPAQPIPDAGTSLVLLSSALAALGVVRRVGRI